MFCHYYTSNLFQFKKFGVEIMKHYPVKNVLREMVQCGVMGIVYGAIISVWHEEQVINLTYLCTLTKAELALLSATKQNPIPTNFGLTRVQS